MRVLVAGWIGSTNLGDELVFAGMRRLLADRGITPVAISQDPQATYLIHGTRAVSGKDLGAVARAARKADVLIFGGGGLLQDDSSPLNLPYHLSRVEVARQRPTPFAGVGLGVGGLSSVLGRRLVRRSMGAAVGITVRDAASHDLLSEVGVPGSRLAADVAFALTAPPIEPSDRLVVSLRRWGGPTRSRRPASKAPDTTPQPHIEALARGIDAAASRTGLKVRFVALQADRDDAVHRRTAQLMTTPDIEFAIPDLDGVLGEFAAARAVISMRYHGGIAATLAGRPVVLIDYASKVSSLADELGDGAHLLTWDPIELDTIPDALQHVIDAGDHVDQARDRLQQRAAGNGQVIDQLLATAGAA